MKKTFTILASAVLIFTSCSNDSKYKIYDVRGHAYYTDSYSKDGDCITFYEKCGCNEASTQTTQTKICGSYVIKENSLDD